MKPLQKKIKENEKNLKLLDDDTAWELKKLLKYMRASGINEYDCALVGSDLIAIVAEARLRGETIDDALGQDKRAFCQQLMEGTRQMDRWERIGFLLEYPLVWLFLNVLIDLCPLNSSFSLGYMAPVRPAELLSLLALPVLGLIGSLISRRFLYLDVRVKVLLWSWIFLLYNQIGRTTNLPGGARVLFHLHYLPAVLVTLALWLAARYARYRNAVPEQRGDTGPFPGRSWTK